MLLNMVYKNKEGNEYYSKCYHTLMFILAARTVNFSGAYNLLIIHTSEEVWAQHK